MLRGRRDARADQEGVRGHRRRRPRRRGGGGQGQRGWKRGDDRVRRAEDVERAGDQPRCRGRREEGRAQADRHAAGGGGGSRAGGIRECRGGGGFRSHEQCSRRSRRSEAVAGGHDGSRGGREQRRVRRAEARGG